MMIVSRPTKINEWQVPFTEIECYESFREIKSQPWRTITYLFIHPFIHLFIYLSIYLSIHFEKHAMN